MIPRLPPLVLAAIGSASIYGIKYVLDRLEPKAIGPPGSSDHFDKVLKYRRNVKWAGRAAAVSGVIYAGYWMYEARQHRNSPAVMSHKDDPDHSFYQDQYKEREKRFAMEREEARKLEREKELAARQHLEKEVTAMEDVLKQNRK